MKKGRKKRVKVTTIEGLASLMVGELDEFRSEVNRRFDEVDSRLDRFEKKLEELDRRVTALEMKVAGLYRLVDEQQMHRLDVTHLTDRIARLEQKIFGK